MKIGICDSGLGGLIIAKAIREYMPQYDYVYLGDTLHLPYGQRSASVIYDLTLKMIKFLFRQDCNLIIIACNTACAIALRKIQQEYLPRHFPDRNVLGVIVPMMEEVHSSDCKKVSLIGTEGLVKTKVYSDELAKISNKNINEYSTPLFVPLLENDGEFLIEQTVRHYDKKYGLFHNEGLILACTHYALIKHHIRSATGEGVKLFSQDEVIPKKLESYLNRHPELRNQLDKNNNISFFVTDYTHRYQKAANKIYGNEINIQETQI